MLRLFTSTNISISLQMMNIDERDDTNDSSLGAPGEEPRATMVPPTSLSTYVSIYF